MTIRVEKTISEFSETDHINLRNYQQNFFIEINIKLKLTNQKNYHNNTDFKLNTL